MSIYGYIISRDDGTISQFDHETGAFVRRFCQINTGWSASVSDFNTTTGLPNPDALGATDTSVPCSLCATSGLWYLLDTYTARVLAFDLTTQTLYAQFGGRRGIGAGKIDLDGTPRSICNVANSLFFLTDNAGGFVVQYSLLGAYQAEYSIAGWATALGLAFDQVTGWCYDTARGVYWALAQSSTAAYAFAVSTSGVATGLVIDLTTRLAANLSITVPGHSGSPSERVRTRGLYYNNGHLLLYSQGHLVQVDLVSATGDVLLVSQTNDLSPGNITTLGDELIYVLRDQANNATILFVIDAAGTVIRSYAEAFSPADGIDGHIANAWDATVSPTVEAPPRTSRGVSMRARIRKVVQETQEMRAAIRKTVTVTQSMRARILNLGPFGAQVPMTMRARIEEPSSFPDQFITSWDMSDVVSQFSRTLTLQAAGRAGFQVGDTLTLYAGYGTDRIKLFHGEIDDISQDLTTDVERWSFSCRDVGALEVSTREIWTNFANTLPRRSGELPTLAAGGVIGQTALSAGIDYGGGGSHYLVNANITAQGKTLLQIAQYIQEPFNQFASRQSYPQVREGTLQMVQVNWNAPPDNGYVVRRGRLKRISRQQTRYLQSPNLIGQTLQVRGATTVVTIFDEIGPQTKIEYFRTLTQADVSGNTAQNTGITGFAQEYVLTEQFSIEETWGDKVLNRTSETYANSVLIGREEEVNLYFEPAGSLGFASIQTASAGPSPLALPYQTNSITSGIDPSDGLFKEMSRSQTDYQYDQQNRLASETTNNTVFDTATQHWVLDSLQVRPISETTGGSSRMRRYSFTNADGVLGFDGVDSQQVGGGRADPAQITGAATVVTFQAMAPTPDFVVDGNRHLVVDPDAGNPWIYENPMLGQSDCEVILGLASAEQALQDGTHRWEECAFDAVLDPNLQSGMAVSLEIEEGVFTDYWLESVSHSFDTDEALTRGTCKRITTDPLP